MDFGAMPPWLLKYDVNLRCNDKTFLSHVRDYYDVMMKKLISHQITHGGNIIAMQIENEYGSYGNDKNYLISLKHLILGHILTHLQTEHMFL